jgi:CheY-like chemotaxis protein/nitrogen-specific signal transduction histidine kinase
VIDRGRGAEDAFFKFSCAPIRDDHGTVAAIMTVAVDVTDHVLARRALTLADQRKDEFLAMLAHELRNPMAAVSTALSLLEQVEGDPVRCAKYRETGKRQMANLIRLVDDLLDVSRITRGKIDLLTEELDLAAVVQQALSTTRPAFEARGHAISVALGSGSFRMRGDGTRLEQIVVNLLTNAAKYTDPHGRVDVSLTRERNNGDVLAVLRVRDSGRGIPTDMLDRVFDLFVQVSPSIDRRTGGLGLGLTLVKRLAEMHGGTVSAASAGPGTGSEFTIRLPILDRAAVGTPTHLTAVDQPTMPPRRILLVEDSEDVRDTLAAYLRGLGHEVFVACDGVEGVARMAELHPDVAFVDIGLPQLDGFEVARRTRAAGTGGLMIALSGYGGEEAKQQARDAGFDLHLTKPVELALLPRMIDKAGKS